MDKILYFFAVTILPLSLGGLSTKLGLLQEKRSKLLFLFGILFLETPIILLILWKLKVKDNYVLLPVLAFCLVCLAGILGFLFSKRLFTDIRQRGTMTFSSALSNQGFLMGGFICYLLYGDAGYSLSVIYILYFHFTIFFVCFPLARYFSVSQKQSVIKMIVSNLWDIRSLPILAILFGVTLNYLQIHYFKAFDLFLKNLIPFATFFFMFAIGMQLKFSFSYFTVKEVHILAIIKFILTPTLAYFLVKVLAIQGLPAKVIFIESFTPAAAYSIMITSLFNLDSDLASKLFVSSTLIFLFTIFPSILVLLQILPF
ncbi:MAG: AEC family transporter [Spirochaetota bacterium]